MLPLWCRTPSRGVLAVGLVWMLAVSGSSAWAASARLLVFVDVAVVSPWYAQFLESLRAAVRQEHPGVEMDVETLPASFSDERDESPPEWMVRKYAGRHYDIVLSARPDSIRSTVQLRDQLWPNAPVVTLFSDTLGPSVRQRARRLSGLRSAHSTTETLALVFRLLPQTRHVAVIARTLDQDLHRGDWRTGLDALKGRASIIDLTGLPAEALLERARTLPPNTAIFFAAPGPTGGRVVSPRDFVKELARQANAPVFVDVSTMLDTGALGGAVLSPDLMAKDVGRQIKALLNGTPPEQIGLQPHSPLRLQFDWHALQRWHIPLDRLPAQHELIGQPPSLWEAYQRQVLTYAAVALAQSALIVALLLERQRRQRAEQRALEHLAHLARLNRGAALGALSAALAHEINQPLGSILSNAETAELLLERPGEVSREALHELLSAIRDDNQRAASVLQRLRAWIANTPGAPQPIELNLVIDGVARLLATEMRLRDAELQLALAPELPRAMADHIQVQQVLLNLVLNALDAVQAMPPRQRRVEVTTAALSSHEVEVSVRDNGPGLIGTVPQRLFEPFYSTKPEGLGVGLAISRSIIEQHGGRLLAHNESDGACFSFTLPAAPAASATARGS